MRKPPENPKELAIAPLRKRPGGNAFTGMITVGRADNNDLVISDGTVSKFHAYFRRLGQRWTITDANSRNGTMVDGQVVYRATDFEM